MEWMDPWKDAAGDGEDWTEPLKAVHDVENDGGMGWMEEHKNADTP